VNREGAETYLRLLAEAMMRRSLAPAHGPPWAQGPGGGRTRVMAVGQALTAVGAIDIGTAEDIVADFDLAVNVRQLHEQASRRAAASMPPAAAPGVAVSGMVAPPGILPAGTVPAAAMARWTARIQPGPLTRAGRLARGWPAESGGSPESGPDPEPPGTGAADRFIPVGLSVPFRDEEISGELYLISFAQTGSGARFIAAWGSRTLSWQHRMGLQYAGLIPLEQLFTVTDDRGARYDLAVTPGSGPEWINEISLRPAPPDDVRWLDIAAPLRPAVRVDLDQQVRVAEPEITEAKLSPGEHLLIMLADRLLTIAPEAGRDWRRHLPMMSPGLPQAMTAGLGDIVAGLEAADVLSPLSPVPARLAALCASLGIGSHGITAAPAPDLPERWLSLLAHYQRRKPDMTQVRDGYAAVATALPELDGIRLALLGLDNTEGSSSLHVLATGITAEGHAGPLGVDLDFPLSLWLRDSGGRWHAARAAGWHRVGGERALRLKLVPPLPRSTAWIEVLAGGRSAEVRTRLPLRWGDPT